MEVEFHFYVILVLKIMKKKRYCMSIVLLTCEIIGYINYIFQDLQNVNDVDMVFKIYMDMWYYTINKK